MCRGKSITSFWDEDYKAIYEAKRIQVEEYAKWVAEYRSREEKAKDFAEKVYWRMLVKETEEAINNLIFGWK